MILHTAALHAGMSRAQRSDAPSAPEGIAADEFDRSRMRAG
jgi:hypothetical protein